MSDTLKKESFDASDEERDEENRAGVRRTPRGHRALILPAECLHAC
ncbi:hypothetical protein [Brevundimonas subvibrioides]